MHQSTLRKSKGTLARAVTMFKSDSAQTYNALRQTIGEAQYLKKSGSSKEAVKTAQTAAGTAVLGLMLNAIWAEGIDFLMAMWKNKGKNYRDEEDELTLLSVLGEVTAGLVGSMAGTVVGGEEIAEIIGKIVTGDMWYGIDAPGNTQLVDLINAVSTSGKDILDFVGEMANVAQNDGDVWKYIADHNEDALAIVKNVVGAAGKYLIGAPQENVEKYLLGAITWISPELAGAYESLFTDTTKAELNGLEGRELSAGVKRIFKEREIDVNGDTVTLIANLYEAGERKAVPGSTPSSVTVNGEERVLNAYQQQSYERVWNSIVSENINELTASDMFFHETAEAQAKMLERLYNHAAEQAKAALFEDVELDGTDASYETLTGMGLSLAECIQIKNRFDSFEEQYDSAANRATAFAYWLDQQSYSSSQEQEIKNSFKYYSFVPISGTKYEEFVAAGLSENDSLTLSGKLGELEPELGKSQVSELQKARVCVDQFSDPDKQMMALSEVMGEASYKKVQIGYDMGVEPEFYVKFKEYIPRFDTDGSGAYSQQEVTTALNELDKHYSPALFAAAGLDKGRLDLSNEQKAVLWQLQTDAKDGKKNPFDTKIGKQVYDLMHQEN